VIALAPGAAVFGKSRVGVIEVKAGPTFLIVLTEPRTRLIGADHELVDDGWHVTVHRDLMVHARSQDRRTVVPLLEPAAADGDAVLLVRVQTAPEPHRVQSDRQQNTWSGAAIFSPLPDDWPDSSAQGGTSFRSGLRERESSLDERFPLMGSAGVRLPVSTTQKLANARRTPWRTSGSSQ
jgi:hypothetical protein